MGEIGKEKAFWLLSAFCFLAIVFAVPFSKMEFPLAAGSFIRYFQSALASKGMLFLIPIVSVLPAGASYVRDSSGGFLKLYAVRISRVEYIQRKTFLIYAGGFLPFFLAGILAFFAGFLFLFPLERKGEVELALVFDSLGMLLRICFVGGIFAEISGVFAAVFKNYYMAYGLPFVCYYLLIILKDRYLPDFYAMYPGEWILAEQYWGRDGSFIWVFFLAFTALVCLLHGVVLGWRVKEI